MKKLSHLRIFFVVYMAVKIVVDVSLVGFNEDLIRSFNLYGLSHIGVSPVTVLIMVCVADIILFAIGWWLLSYLLQKRNWARIVLLVIGCLAVLDALSGLLLHSQSVRLLNQMFSDADWNRIIFIDHVTDVLGLVYFGYLIYLLQFTGDVRQIFTPSPDVVKQM